MCSVPRCKRKLTIKFEYLNETFETLRYQAVNDHNWSFQNSRVGSGEVGWVHCDICTKAFEEK
jgi:hypothetical protein